MHRHKSAFSKQNTPARVPESCSGALCMDQVQFDGSAACERFAVNRLRLNAPRARVVCRDCGQPLLDHRRETVAEEDVVLHLSILEAQDGGNCIAEMADENVGALFIGARNVSLRAFVEKHAVAAVVNATNLHLEERSDFREWARKVERLEQEGLIEVLRLGWTDTHDQQLDRLDDAVAFIAKHRNAGKNVAVHCAQGKVMRALKKNQVVFGCLIICRVAAAPLSLLT